MKIYKRSERILRTRAVVHGLKSAGAEIKIIGEYMKWKELDDGSKLSISMTIYQVKTNERTAYFFSDALGMFACEAFTDINEGYAWLKEHGYKTDHDFYIEDYGMTEETWQEWNKGN